MEQPITKDMTFHCFFEQSGTFKNEFKKLGYNAIDYDICDDYGQTDVVIDLFAEIEKAYGGGQNKHNVLELNRLVFLPSRGKRNYANMLISKSLKLLPKRMFVVSYADTGQGHIGYVYQATSWFYTGCTKVCTDIKGINGGHSRHYEKQETQRQRRTAKHRYVTITGTKRDKKELKKQMKWQILKKYPKGESKRYDDKRKIDIQGTLF